MENSRRELARLLPDRDGRVLATFAIDFDTAAALKNVLFDARRRADNGLGGAAFYAKTV